MPCVQKDDKKDENVCNYVRIAGEDEKFWTLQSKSFTYVQSNAAGTGGNEHSPPVPAAFAWTLGKFLRSG